MKSIKKQYGQFFTKKCIADFMAKLVTNEKDTCNVLDPAVGEGVFIDSVKKLNDKAKFLSFEIDETLLKNFNECSALESNVKNENYLYSFFEEKFDIIICNPPYSKFQEISDREKLIKLFYQKYNIRLSGYTNYCVYFLIKSLNELNDNGKCIYIIPYEFLNCGYGKTVKEYLLNQGYLKEIYKFDNNIKLFNDAITTSCIMLFEKSKHNSVDFISITDIKEIETFNFQNKKTYRYEDLDFKEKWIKYFSVRDNKKEYRNIIRLSQIGRVKRGIATGNNKFFSLNKDKITSLHLSENVCVPCITKSPDIKCLKLTQEKFLELYSQNKNVCIFDGTKAIKEEDWAYIEYGEKTKVNEAYLTSHRNPWYSIEKKDISPILISVFNRNKLKVIRNEANVLNLTAFHSLFINDLDLVNIYFCYLITPIAQEILFLNKREYGDGLDKFEPNDLNEAFVLDVNVISEDDKKTILAIYDNLNEGGIDELNMLFKKYIA